MTLLAALDPSLLALKTNCDTAEEAISIIERIGAWSSIASSTGAMRLLVSSFTSEALARADCYPSAPAIQDLLQRFNLEAVYAPNDIRQNINNILKRGLTLEDLAGCSELLADELSVKPNLVDPRTPPDVAHAVITTHAACALGLYLNRFLESGLLLHSAYAGENLRRADINGRVTYVPTNEPFTVDADVVASIGVVTSPSTSLSVVNAGGLWRDAETTFDIAIAIAFGCAQELLEREPGKKLDFERLQFAIGPGFLGSLQRHQALGDQKYSTVVFQKCCRAIVDLASVAQPMWRPSGSKGKERVDWMRARDNAKAFRIHLTEHNEGMRLMVWRTDRGLIELANVGNKAEVEIDEGADGQAMTFDDFASPLFLKQ